ncbi:MAG: serine--tRNA ligase [Deltaproteobacteria bacterium]|nr:serine--tRNA ligase [Deltaproteobacteria bacterium]
MLDIKIIREHPERVKESILRRHLDPAKANVEELLALDGRWRELQGSCDTMRARRNERSDQIKSLKGEDRQAAVDEVRGLKTELAAVEAELERVQGERDALLRRMPNLLAEDVPNGKTDADNLEVARWGTIPSFDFEPRDHVELGALTGTLDFDRAAKVTGANFYYLKHEAALLELALCSFAASRLVPAGFRPIATPDLAKAQVLEGIGFAPRGPETQVYSVENSDLCLVGTAEITVGGYHSGEILDADELPLRYLGLSHCFRTEAGAYGRESRGLYRVHQFTKAEMFAICAPEDSVALHEEIRGHEEALMQALGLPYRVVNVCSGDLGAPAAKKYDLEAWMPGRKAYGEVTSCSNCTDYQSRRLNIRFRRDAKAAPQVVHMLNGTALAISRTLIAIYENYQERDGSIRIPEVLRPFLPGTEVIPRRRG